MKSNLSNVSLTDGVIPAVGFGGDGAAVALDASAAAAPLLVQELPRDLQSGRRQEAVALPARVDNSIHECSTTWLCGSKGTWLRDSVSIETYRAVHNANSLKYAYTVQGDSAGRGPGWMGLSSIMFGQWITQKSRELARSKSINQGPPPAESPYNGK